MVEVTCGDDGELFITSKFNNTDQYIYDGLECAGPNDHTDASDAAQYGSGLA